MDAVARVQPKEVLEAAGATQIAGRGLPPRTSRARAGWATIPSARPSTVTARCTASSGLYVGDASLIPRTLSVNPSLTIMALATRLADHLAA